jgi:CBS domain containing-hemolysin-like protein/mannitol/fructose-specific phosphotransferase system IIA component (Ntr-type)
MLIILLLATLLLLLLNAFFVLAEFASVKVRPTRVEELVDDGVARAKVLQRIQHHLDEYLSVCQVGITLASIGLGFVSKPAFQQIVKVPLTWLGLASPAVVDATAIGTAYVVVSYLHILLGELVPKSIAIRRAEASGLWIAVPLRVCHFIFFVPLYILNGSANAVLRLLGLSAPLRDPTHTEDEIRIILERAQSSGAFSFLRLLLMENVFDLGGLKVKDAMRPPRLVKTLHITAPWADNLKTIRESKYSRFPVLADGQPLPLGVVHVKDVLHHELNKQDAPDLKKVLRPYLKVTDDLPLEALLSQLQRLRRRVAIVVDRKGQWVGYITLEDVIEEIIGSVEDEFEKEPPLFLAETMSAGRIVLGLTAAGITEAIPLILAHVDQAELPLPREKIARAVLEREAEFSTYLGQGLAVPHARLEGIERPVVIFAQSKGGIPAKGTGEQIHVLFMLLTPVSAPQFQVRLLARISGLMQSEYVVECLRNYQSPQSILEIIRAADPAILS